MKKKKKKGGGGGANAPVYDAQALRADLLAIPLAEKTVETLEMDVRTICLHHGVGLARDRIERAPNGGRLKGVRLKCAHWIKKKQAEGRPSGPSGERSFPAFFFFFVCARYDIFRSVEKR